MRTPIEPLIELSGLLHDRSVERWAERSTRSALRRSGPTCADADGGREPFMIGIGGPVAVGKSTLAAALATVIGEWPERPSVQIVATDSFLYSNAELERLGLTMSKGAPTTYDHDAMRATLARLRAGDVDVEVPSYSHRTYDVVAGAFDPVGGSDVVLVEGLHVASVSELLDVVLYVDATAADLERWFVERFERLRLGSVDDPGSFFHQFAELDADTADVVARWTWTEINLVNIVEHVEPTREQADIVVHLGSTHRIERIGLR